MGTATGSFVVEIAGRDASAEEREREQSERPQSESQWQWQWQCRATDGLEWPRAWVVSFVDAAARR